MKPSIQLFKNAFIVCIAIFMFGCSESKEELTSQIQTLEKAMYKDNAINTTSAQELIQKCDQYADSYKEDTLAPQYLFKGAEVAITIKEYQKAIDNLDRTYTQYPNYSKRVEALFLKGFVYENNLNQKEKAKEIYEQVIEKHPDHHFVDDAQAAIKMLYMTDEELMEMLKSMNPTQVDTLNP